MHELSVVFEIAKQVQALAEQYHVPKIAVVTLDIGEVSMIVHPYLQDCWEWTRKKYDALHECLLRIHTIKAVTRCNDCGETYSTVSYGKTCPHCGSENTVLVCGNEIRIKDIAVPNDPEPDSDASPEAK